MLDNREGGEKSVPWEDKTAQYVSNNHYFVEVWLDAVSSCCDTSLI